jgi:hypothetical protein
MLIYLFPLPYPLVAVVALSMISPGGGSPVHRSLLVAPSPPSSSPSGNMCTDFLSHLLDPGGGDTAHRCGSHLRCWAGRRLRLYAPLKLQIPQADQQPPGPSIHHIIQSSPLVHAYPYSSSRRHFFVNVFVACFSRTRATLFDFNGLHDCREYRERKIFVAWQKISA